MGHVYRNIGFLSAATTAGIALLAVSTTPAGAFWFNNSSQPVAMPGYSPPSMVRPARPSPSPTATAARREKEKEKEKPAAAAADLGAQAKEPLHIMISIDKQQLTLYSGSHPIAHTRVSTGTASHPTPTGVFSVIQKDRWHRSNLYGDAPMFYMQRITWSGVALHQGVVPNHPASHGCIRLPEAFAKQLWGTTKLGARVIITRGEAAPAPFSHARLFTLKREPLQAKREAPATDGSTDLVKAASQAFARSQAFSRTDVTTTETFKLSDPAFDPARAPLLHAPADIVAKDVVKSAYNAFELRRVKPAARAAAANAPSTTDGTVERPLKPGPIAVFISRKEGKLFVRKGFAPVFDVPVTIAQPEQPLGTHVFTALAVNEDNATLRWTVVTVPNNTAPAKKPQAAKKGEPVVVAAPALPPSNAAGALDRITIPEEALDRITELMSPGASLVISDQGLGGETGNGTDFIVLTR
ncbi:MAG TPA: L,D-transpeptidase [Tepidisphaeraceae bacterium]|nr:L,D-transpeptidase [Tepidisphaeraceae bacterium]